MAVDAASFVGSALLILAIRRQEAPRQPSPAEAAGDRRPGMRREIAEGLRYVLGNRNLRSIAACTGTSNLCSNIVFAVFAVYAYRELELSPATIGLVGGIGGFGVLLGALLASPIAAKIGVGRTILGSSLFFGPSALLIPLAPANIAPAFFAVAFFFEGMFGVIYNVNQVSLRQAITPERLLGRLNGTMRFLVWGTIPVGSLIGGILGSVVGVHIAIWIGAVLNVLTFLPILFSPVPAIRTIPEQPEEPDEAVRASAAAVGDDRLAGGEVDELGRAGTAEPATYPDER